MQALSDFDKVNLIKQASLRNYFTSHQVKSLLDVVSYRKGKLEVAVRIACRGSLEQGLLRTYAHVHVQSACARCACACACACKCMCMCMCMHVQVHHAFFYLKVAVMLHPRTVDPHNFVNVLNSLNSEADRQAVLDMCTSVKSVKARK